MASLHQPDTLEPLGSTAREYGDMDDARPSRKGFRLIDAARHRMPRILHDLTEASALDLREPDNVQLLTRRVERLHFSLELFGTCLGDLIADNSLLVARAHGQLREVNARNELAMIIDRVSKSQPDTAKQQHNLAEQIRADVQERIESLIPTWRARDLNAVLRWIDQTLSTPS